MRDTEIISQKERPIINHNKQCMDNIEKGVICFSSAPSKEKLTSTSAGLWSSKLFDLPIRLSLPPLLPLRRAIRKGIRMRLPADILRVSKNTKGTVNNSLVCLLKLTFVASRRFKIPPKLCRVPDWSQGSVASLPCYSRRPINCGKTLYLLSCCCNFCYFK